MGIDLWIAIAVMSVLAALATVIVATCLYSDTGHRRSGNIAARLRLNRNLIDSAWTHKVREFCKSSFRAEIGP